MDETNPDNKSNLPSSSSSTHNPNQSSSSSSTIPNPITNQEDLSVAEMISGPTPTFFSDIAQASTSTPFDDVQQPLQNPTTSNVVETMIQDSHSPSPSPSSSNAPLQQQQQQQQAEDPILFIDVMEGPDGRIMIPYPYSRKHDAFVVKQRPGGLQQLIPRDDLEQTLFMEYPNMLPLKRPAPSLKISSDSRKIKKKPKPKPSFIPYTYLRPRRRPRLASSSDPTFKVPPLPPSRPSGDDDHDDVVEFVFTILDDEDEDDDNDHSPKSGDDHDKDDHNNNAGSSSIST